MRPERDIRSWRIRRPTSLTTVEWMTRSDALRPVRCNGKLPTNGTAIFKDTASEIQLRNV